MMPTQETMLDQPYFSSQNTYPPRYYQRNEINRTMDAIAKGQNRLLVMATGTGETYNSVSDRLPAAEKRHEAKGAVSS